MRKRPSNGNTRNRCPGASISTPISNLILKMVAEITSHHKKVLKFYTVLLTKPGGQQVGPLTGAEQTTSLCTSGFDYLFEMIFI